MSAYASREREEPIAAFVLSLISGLLILAGSGLVMSFSGQLSSYYYGGMMGGHYGMINGYYGMMRGFGFGGMWFYGLAAIGIISGIIILVGAIMLYNQPTKTSTWGALILAFSIVSFFGMSGFFIGAILGVLGGILAITWKRGVSLTPSKSPRAFS